MKQRLYNRINREVLKDRLLEDPVERTTLSFYRYAHIEDPATFRDDLYIALSGVEVYGRIYVAREGVNGQISIPSEKMDEFKTILDGFPMLAGVRLNIAIEDDGRSFYKLKIKVRPKIVADGLNDDRFDVTDKGVHLDAEGFNALTDREKTIIVDMRNHYESEVGHFRDAILPKAETFRDLLPEVVNMLEVHKDKPIVMYCTGGIRCEKASAYLKYKGFKDVYQLDGGIIEYSRQVEKNDLENKFVGKNFVFDERLGERITEEVVARCHQCGEPCDQHVNCANDACHLLFIQCPTCAARFEKCCSSKCRDFHNLSEDEQRLRRKTESFNGSKFGKGRYKAFTPGDEKNKGIVLD